MIKKKLALLTLGATLLTSLLPALFSEQEEVYASGTCRSFVDGAYHRGIYYSRSYDYTNNLTRAAYFQSSTSFPSAPVYRYTDFYSPAYPSDLISTYGWRQSFWNKYKSEQWDSATVQDAQNYTPEGSATVFQPHSTGSGNRFKSENGNYYRYRKGVRVYWTHDQQVTDASGPSTSASPTSGGWTNGNYTVSFSAWDNGCGGFKGYKYDWSTGDTADAWSSQVNSSSGSYTLSSEGTWNFHLYTVDTLGNSTTQKFGPYQIDKSKAAENGSWVLDSAYNNGNDYWIKPGDSVRIRLKGNDTLSGIHYSYLRLTGAGQDHRSQHGWDQASNHNNEWMTGTYTDVTSVSEITESGGDREAEWTVKALSNSDNKDFTIQGYYIDYAGNESGLYFDTYKNLRIDGTAPIVSATPTSKEWSQGVNVTMSNSDSRSGVNSFNCKWSTSTSKPTSGWSSSCSNLSLTTQGTWYLHYQSSDNTGNYSSGYYGPYKIDTTDPSGTFNPYSSGWTNNSVTLTFDPSDLGGSGVKKWRYALSSNNGSSWNSWTSWITGDTSSSISLNSTGNWKIKTEVVDNADNYGYPSSGTYNIDKTNPYHVSHSIFDALYQNGNDYWIKPNDTVRVILENGDANSGIIQSYIRLSGSGNDMRSYHDWSGTTTNFSNVSASYAGTYTKTTGASEISEVGAKKKVEFSINALSTSNNKNFNVEYYHRDLVTNSIGYVDTGMNLKIDGDAPTVAANPSSQNWTNQTVSVDLSYNDSRSGVNYEYCKWTLSTATPVTGTYSTNCNTVSTSGDGVWYLHYETRDLVGNLRKGYFGPYKIDKTNPNGSYTPNNSAWTPNDVTTTFNPSDTTGGSGVDKWKYRISSNDGSTYGGYSTFTYGDINKDIKMSSSGWWKIESLVYDIAGNSQTVTSGTFLIDKTRPNGNIVENPVNVWTRNATLTATGSDVHSGLNRIKLPDNTWVYGTTADYSVDKNGTYTFVFEDNVGHLTTKSITVSNIDDVNPFVWSATLSPNVSTNQNVTILLDTGDVHSGVNKIVKPNSTVAFGSSTTYTVSQNGSYIFSVVDNVGNIYKHTVKVNNIDKVLPELDYLTLLQKKDGKFQVTATASDDSGIKSIALNTGQVILKDPNRSYYIVDNIPNNNKPTYVKITDNAGNVTNPIYFLDIPTLKYNSLDFDTSYPFSRAMKDDVKIAMNGTQTLSYKLGFKDFTCSSKPCTITFTKNDEALAINSTDKFASMRELEITNIDKTAVDLVLQGDRDKNDVISLNWNLNLNNTLVTCLSSSDFKTFNPAGTAQSFAAKQETYKCSVEGEYQRNTVKSNTVTIHPDYSGDTLIYTPPSSLPLEEFKKVYKEKSVTGEFYFLNINRDNTDIKLVPVPTTLH